MPKKKLQLELKRPGIFDKIECMAVDFTSEEASNPSEDPLVFVNQLEKEIREASEVRESLTDPECITYCDTLKSKVSQSLQRLV